MSEFNQLGFTTVASVLSKRQCADLANKVSALPKSALTNLGAGSRNLLNEPWCTELGHELSRHVLFRPFLGQKRANGLARTEQPDTSTPDLIPVQCTYFAKSSQTNWLVPVHQDLSIPVAKRIVHADWSAWSVKQGQVFVQPPLEVLQRMVAIRLHLDDCSADDGPLWLVPGSHLLGKLDIQQAADRRANEVVCQALAGDALVMRPLLLHRSSKASGLSRRRVLHFVYGPPQLPDGAAWGAEF